MDQLSPTLPKIRTRHGHRSVVTPVFHCILSSPCCFICVSVASPSLSEFAVLLFSAQLLFISLVSSVLFPVTPQPNQLLLCSLVSLPAPSFHLHLILSLSGSIKLDGLGFNFCIFVTSCFILLCLSCHLWCNHFLSSFLPC